MKEHYYILFVFVAVMAMGTLCGPETHAGQLDEITVMHTPAGVRYGLLGPKPAAPAPTLFIFASTLEDSLRSPDFMKAGAILAKQGFICVALDAPCHGKDAKAGEPTGLNGWAHRLKKGDLLIPTFTAQASAVLDELIEKGYTDPKQVAVCGTSRGGFLALHWAAAEPRIKCAVGFAPVTNLLALREFQGLEKHAQTNALKLQHVADKLAGKRVWVCIGNNDERVSTDDAIQFTRKVVAASVQRKLPAKIEIHVMTSLGHRIHETAHDEAAAWIAARIAE